MATLKQLIQLTNSTQGDSAQVALKLLLDAIEQLDWTTLDGDLLSPLAAVYETLPETPARTGYLQILMKTSDRIRQLQSEIDLPNAKNRR